ncbi:MAG: hypothetical protein UT66_C0006G0001 [candidate division CPR2 bacterium GW2011_GWC1_39_9]|uniref:VWFA domain-containing protein n=1 Tax=candidate division CPR2 bacterium GW2011_GWC2_39_10 TaxID=1618345 RepID=A0A0G0PUN0_UNCC2|nr:MAG: hypothetical protein UT18_C0029G0013 [candidate division CPR2 bacterium GW2011_GWC2_39_10]KKR35934.1 MAG: hypothetical protein UT66_C0006G0001 [candidate division CPR2 bacterium GW2011_GWC1_39_9]
MSQFTFRTSPPATYIPPSAEEMREVANKVRLGSFSRDLVTDLCNLEAGGKVNPPSFYRDTVRGREENKLPAADSSGNWRLLSGSTTKSRQQALQDRIEKSMRYHTNVCDFLQSLDIQSYPGTTPLEKAMNLLKLLAQKQGGSSGGEGGEPLPLFTENDQSEKVGEELNRLMDEIDNLSDDEKALLDPEDKSGSGKSENGDENLQKMKLAEDFLKGKEIMLQISRNLDKLTRMQVRKSKKQLPDPAGEEIRQRPIAHMGEMSRMTKSEYALPSVYRTYRIVTHASQVRERVTTIEMKQLLYIIIDCSGSMGQGQRIYKAGGILINRLKAVIAGEAELYVRLFDTQLKEEHHASTAAEAKELIKHFTEKNYSGGSTDISGCAKLAQERIEEIISQGSTYRPELVVITDGDDQINVTTKDFVGTKMHAFVVECANKALTDLAVQTGGVGIGNL